MSCDDGIAEEETGAAGRMLKRMEGTPPSPRERSSSPEPDLAYAKDDLNNHRRRASGGYQGNF